MEYQDQNGEVRHLGVGVVTIDVHQAQAQSPIELTAYSVGQLRLQSIELTARNKSTHAVTVTGLSFAMPGVAVETTMELMPSSPDVHSASLAPAPSIHPVDDIVIQPDEETSIRFVLAASDVETVRFAEIAPFLTLEGDPFEMPIPLQVYLSPFAGEQDLMDYLSTLPADAHHAR